MNNSNIPTEKLDIRIHGKSYQLHCAADQKDHILQLADEINSRAQDISTTMSHAGYLHILMMTCLHLADELYEARQEIGAIHEKILLNDEEMGGFLAKHTDIGTDAPSQDNGDAIQKIIKSIETMSKKLDMLK